MKRGQFETLLNEFLIRIKSNVLSNVVRIYLFICPVVILAKLFKQKLWIQGVSWDWDFGFSLLDEQLLCDIKVCFCANPKSFSLFMGDLPAARVLQVKAFTHSGVDFGPVSIPLSKHPGVKSDVGFVIRSFSGFLYKLRFNRIWL